MQKTKKLQKIKFYIIDLTRIKGMGDFRCPKCGTKISPADETEDTYTILETVTKDNNLDKIILQCNRCRSHIHLIGFHILNQVK